MRYPLRKDAIYQYNVDTEWVGAVNFVFVQDYIFLILRSDTMPSHAGQIAFVGGHRHSDEIHPLTTAKREFEEETGMNSDILKDLTILEPVVTSKLQQIYPVVSWVDMDPLVFIDSVESNGEWSNAYLAKAEYIFNTDHWSRGRMHRGRTYDVYFCPIPKSEVLEKSPDNDIKVILWGATAKIIWNFFKIHIDDANFQD
jgi:8-oxo-dGTP pyrophosphatase MutT (NUDIX family)